MRSRHVLRALAVALALVGLVLPAAFGAVVRTTLPADIGPVGEFCTGTADGEVGVVAGPADISGGTGTGSLRLRQGDVTEVVGISRAFDLLSTFSFVSFNFYDPDVYGVAPFDVSTWIDIRVTTASGTYHLVQFLEGGPAWQSHEATATTTYQLAQEVTGGWTLLDSTTVSAFIAQHGDGAGAVRILRAPCYAGYVTGNPAAWQPPPGIGTDTYLDLVTFAFTGDPGTTYDFEDHAYSLAASTDSPTIVAGEHMHVAATLRRDGAVFSGAMLTLEKRPAGQATWTLAGTALTGATGRAVLDVHPITCTDYRWTYAGATRSPTVRVGVHTRVTLTLADSTLHRGQRLVATGRTTPAKPGLTATLWRRTATGTVRLASATVSATGAFRITRTVRSAGTYRVLVTVPAATGNLAGTSAVRTATVS